MTDSEYTNAEISRTLGKIEATLTKFEETLTRFDHQLYGNGQPGKLTTMDSRLGILENFKSYIKGGFATLGALVTLIGGTTLYHLFFEYRR